MVGAVLVRGGKIVGTGYHRHAGGDHAEIAALKQAGAKSRGASLYITLEPCSHHGRTPPCTRALIQSGIKEVVAAMKDPNPLVAGRGFQQLRRAGIKVRVGLGEAECRSMLEAFAKYITRHVPFVTLKLAATLDGKIATASGDARWVSGERSRALVQRWRNEMDAVVVGVETVLKDDPQLTCRIGAGRNPYRVVLDSRLRIPLTSRLLRQWDGEKTIVATTHRGSMAKARAIEKLGARVWRLPQRDARISWPALIKRLAKLGIVSVLIEGGATVAASALRNKVVDKIEFFYAPKILGGDGRVMIDRLGIGEMARSMAIRNLTVKKIGTDILVSGYL